MNPPYIRVRDKGFKDEGPVHRVVISKPFYMAKYEITQSQWELLMGKHPHLEGLRKEKDHDGVGANKAMNEMSWTACQDYLRKLKAKAPGHAFALPTEAQWEHACRAGSTTEFHFGDDDKALGDYAWFEGNMNWVGHPGYRGKLFYHDVGLKKPNAFGLYDMHGGVWEWCADQYDPDYYFTATLVNPTGPEKGHGPIAITGATGGCSSFAIDMLAGLGYTVVASTGKSAASEYLKAIGAAEVIGRDAIAASDKPLDEQRWAGAIDAVGGKPLQDLLRSMKKRGVVCSFGNAAGESFVSSIYPFILRSVALAGINANHPLPDRGSAWTRMARGGDLRPQHLDRICFEIPFAGLKDYCEEVIAGGIRGRAVVRFG